MPRRTLTEPQDLRDLNLASSIALAVGIYSFFVALGLIFQPAQYWSSTSLMGYMINHISPWPPAAVHIFLGVALVLAAQKETRLFLALVATTAVFVFWAIAPLVAAKVGMLPYPSITGFLNYGWFASISAVALIKTWRLRKRADLLRRAP